MGASMGYRAMFERQGEMAAGLLAGRLEGISVPDLMWSLCRGDADGVLRVTRDGMRKTLYLEHGRIVFAASSDPDDRLGELLLRKGWVMLDQLESALRSLGSGKRLGTILVEAGHLSPENLVNGVLTQVREIAMDLFTWEAGEYGFEPGPLPTQEVITLDIGTGELLLQGIRRIRSFTRIRRSVGRPRTVYRLRPGGRDLVEGLSLTSGEEQLLSRLDGGPECIETLCQDVYLSNFEVYQALWALKVLGSIEVEDRPGTIVDDAAVAGRFGAETITPVLVRLCRSGETGVLYLSRGSLERTMHVRGGQVVFATSNDIDDGLISYLLRRGVISLRDREETAKRLLSNKRVGTILREMGVIDELDLRNMVREHLCEILHDTVAWSSGEYAFVPGELPTIEDITLDVTIESLTAAGLHRITSWSRVRDGIGGIHQRLALSPDFLTVLDRMSIGPAEWEVVTSLKEPRTALEVCRQTGLGDFRVTQILWSLRMLGAVVPAEEVDDSADVHGVAADLVMPAALALDDAAQDAFGEDSGADRDVGSAQDESPAAAPMFGESRDDDAGLRSSDRPEDDDDESNEAETDVDLVAADVPADAPLFEVAEPGEVTIEAASEQSWLPAEQERDSQAFEVAGPGEAPIEPAAAASWLSEDPTAGESPSFEVGTPGEGSTEAEAAEGWLAEMPAVGDPPPFEFATPGTGPSENEAADGWLPDAAPAVPPAFEVADPDDDPVEHDDEPVREHAWSASEPQADDMPLAVAESDDGPVEHDDDIDDVDHGGSWSGRRDPDAEPGWAARDSHDHAAADVMPSDNTQVLSREEVDAAIGREASPDETQAIDPELVRRVLEGAAAGSAGLDPGPETDHEPSASDAAGDAPPFAVVDDQEVEPEPETVDAAAPDNGESYDPWTPPEDLESTIARFNARQRVLYRTIRAEIGAGAVNFIRSCCGKVASAPTDPFEGVDLRNDGTWDADALRQAAIDQKLEDPWAEYERLLELEFDLLKIQIGEARAQALREQMDRAAVQPAR